MSTAISSRIAALRQAMAERHVDACLIVSSDPHQSEYLPDHWQTRAWLSGFTGSAGVLVVTPDHAGLWTDARYFLQAGQQLKDSGITLHKLKVPHTPEHLDWLAENLPEGATLSVDGAVLSLAAIRSLRRKLGARGTQVDTRYDLADGIWPDRPPRPQSEVFEFPEHYAGQSRRDKLAGVRRYLEQQGLDYFVVTTLDDIAWALNIRAADVDCNPVCLSFLVIGRRQAWWWVGEERIADDLADGLAFDQVTLAPYDGLGQWLDALPEETVVGVDPASISVRLYEALGSVRARECASPLPDMKGIKNATEIRHLREAMRKDGVALLRLYRWIEAELGQRPLSEARVADQLHAFRGEQGDFYGDSFSAIVGYGPNGAIIHYKPEHGQCAELKPEGLLLLDSGGQYLQGTTDITRTTALGEPTPTQKRHFTLVLKGHIALASARFPEGTPGVQLDTLARVPLWEQGLNFGHGTGHGVGFFLCVHEGPQRIGASAAAASAQVALAPGMLTSNEPGLYIDGAYGIRIENLILCVEDSATAYGRFLRFETLSLFPIDKNLIMPELLTEQEERWLNEYHQRVWEELSPRLSPDEQAWLKPRCSPL